MSTVAIVGITAGAIAGAGAIAAVADSGGGGGGSTPAPTPTPTPEPTPTPTPTPGPPSTVTGTWLLLMRCTNASYDVFNLLINLNQSTGGAISGSTSGTDYDGTPLQMTLSGTYNSTSKVLSATAITSFTGSSGTRIDTFTTTMTSNDTGYIATTQSGSIQGCPAYIRMIKQ
ncbi:MAG: hypothetical protein EHM85_06990 [Desulfobacteraceae bacterium]|nr:MAG: hypothetical protein EHM85_06990 [Desulfobacteraceae bacterium]